MSHSSSISVVVVSSLPIRLQFVYMIYRVQRCVLHKPYSCC